MLPLYPIAPRLMRSKTFAALALCLVPALLGGCSAADSLRTTAYDIRARLDPETHAFAGQAILTMQCEPPDAASRGPLTVDIALNRCLKIERLRGDGVEITKGPTLVSENGDEPALLVVHRLTLDPTAKQFTLTLEYAGELFQDVQRGERPGQIHNFEMSAHIGAEGVYLDASGGWYPAIRQSPVEPPRGELATYSLSVKPIDGMELVAGAAFDRRASEQSGRLEWRGKFPMDGLVLVGGPHHVKERDAQDTQIALHYTRPEDPEALGLIERNTDMFLQAAAGYLERYTPLVGPYPFEKFTIVENFFSSGFAFPEFTLLNQRLLQMGPRALRHGFLDHEMLHSWWGCSIYVDPADGNWCEAITSYAANYYGYILDGDEPGARKYRRNACVAVTLLKPDQNKPLGDFSRDGGPSRTVGYQKGAMVFHMLARKIGQDNFWAAMRRLTDEYTGKHADWNDFQNLFEQAGGMNLDRFFQEWVRESGAPRLVMREAVWRAKKHILELTVDQGETSFELDLPLRIISEDGAAIENIVTLRKKTETVKIPLDLPPSSVVLDPDFHLIRELQDYETMPTSGATLADERLLVVTPGDHMSKFYQTVIDRFSDEKEPSDVIQCPAGDLTADMLGAQSVLILGSAVHAPPVRDLLSRTNCPVAWRDPGFQIDDDAYDNPNQSVFCTVHHPDRPGGGVTVYFGNSEDALGRSDLLLFYRNSLVAFETTLRESEGEKTYKSRVIARRDFETPQEIKVVNK